MVLLMGSCFPFSSINPLVGSFFWDPFEQWEVPFAWRHAGLSEMRAFLQSERDAGRYHPILSEGLDD